MTLNKYFTFIKDEDQLDKDFEQELKNNPLAITRETAKFFREEMKATLDHYRCRRLARLLYRLLELLDKTDDRSIEDAFRDGWENGWDSHRAKAQTSGNISVCYSADEFDPDWEASKTKKKMEER